jgi:hypothetical protein
MKRIFFETNVQGIEAVDVNDKDQIIGIHPPQNKAHFLTNKIVVFAEPKTTLQVKGKLRKEESFTTYMINGIIHDIE